jgi:hypothetical protein
MDYIINSSLNPIIFDPVAPELRRIEKTDQLLGWTLSVLIGAGV